MSTPPLHRHQLAWLAPAGWGDVLARRWEAPLHDCVDRWAREPWPLVVTRQPTPMQATGSIALGLPTPAAWGRQRLAIPARREHVLFFGEFPEAAQVETMMPARDRAAWRRLCDAFDAAGVLPRVHGSFGWQWLTGMAYVHGDSDVDLCIEVSDAGQADEVAGLLKAESLSGRRLDGELVFARGRAVAWREWVDWRAGRAKSVLVKHLHGCALSHDPCVDSSLAAESLP